MRWEDIKTAIVDSNEVQKLFIEDQKAKLDYVKNQNAALQARLEELEANASSPGKTYRAKESTEHLNLFSRWLRRPHDNEAKHRLGEFESKVVSIGSDPGGGFAVPEEIAREIERLELRLSPVRALVRVVNVSTGDYKHIVNIRGTTSGWVSETGTRSETVTPLLREVAPIFGELYAYPQTTEWALDDAFFNIGDWLAEEVAQEFAVQEGTAVITGNGTDKPTGMINTVPTSVDDFGSPLRAAAVYQFVASAASPDAILPDSLIDLVYKVNSAYRANGTWVMNSATAGAVRKLKDDQKQDLWAPALAAGQPDMLLGYPVVTWEQMEDIGANKHPVAFGDFRRGYLLAQRTQIRITVDANITTPGRIKYFVRRREGGHVLDNNAVKFLKTT